LRTVAKGEAPSAASLPPNQPSCLSQRYGPVRPVVWEGRGRESSPYPNAANFLRRDNEKSTAGDASRPAVGLRRAGTCHDQGGAPIMTSTILVEAVTRRSAVQKMIGALGQKSALV